MEQHTLHYLFADCGGRLIEIHAFDRTAHPAPACPCCASEMVAVQGGQREWHFRHKAGGGCDEQEYAQSCAAHEQRARRAAARQRRGAKPKAAPPLAAGAEWLEHPLVVGVGVLAAAAFLFLVGESRRS